MKPQERRFEGIWIPAEIWLSRELTMQEKIMLVEICSLDNENGCYATNSYFAEFFNLSKARISQIIKSLDEKKLINVKYIYKGNEVDKRIITINGNKFIQFLGIKFSKQGIKYSKIDNINDINNINIINDNIFINKNIDQKNNIDIINNNKMQKRKTKKQEKELFLKEEETKINNLIINYTNDIEIQKLLIQYVEVRKQKGLTSAQFEIILEDLKNNCANNKLSTISCIRKAIAGGWSQIVFTNSNKQLNYNSIDNTAGHFTGNPKISDLDFGFMTFEAAKDYVSKMALADMTKNQREFFNKYCLAKDEQGNNLEF